MKNKKSKVKLKRKVAEELGTWSKYVCPYCEVVNWVGRKGPDYSFIVKCYFCGEEFYTDPYMSAIFGEENIEKDGCSCGDSFPRQ